MKAKNIFLSIITTILIFSCTEEIDIKLDDTYQRVVFDGKLTNEYKRHYVKITKSANYFYNKPPEPITNVVVTISDGYTTYNLVEESPGLYLTDSLAGVVGSTYIMKAKIDGITYTASSTMKYCTPIDSIKFEENRFEETDELDVKMYSYEPPEENFYVWNAFKKSDPQDSLKNLTMSNDAFFNGNYVSGVVIQDILAQEGDTVILEMRSVDEAYFKFIQNAWREASESGGGNSPFSGPPANIVGNISNDALGCFAVYSFVTQEGVVPNLD